MKASPPLSRPPAPRAPTPLPLALRAPTLLPLALLALTTLPACREAPPPETPSAEAAPTTAAPAPAEAPPAEPAPPAAPVADARTALQFADAWAAVQTAPIEERGTRGKALRDDWHGRVYTWTGYAVAGLCLDPSHTCAVHVFDRGRTPLTAKLGGHFPQVRFAPPAYAALKAACKGKAGCVVTFRARLAETVTDPAEPLRLVFADAEFVEGRDPRPEETWFARPPGAPTPARVPNAKLRTGEPVKRALKLPARVF